MERMMYVITPLRIDVKSSHLPRPYDARIIQITLGDEDQMPAEMRHQFVNLGSELFKKRDRRCIHNCMHGVESKAINVVVAQPHLRVVAEIAAHLVAQGPIEVQALAPGRRMSLTEIRAELWKIIA